MHKRILYAVLNWGLGHASRSIPIIKQLIEEGNEVVIASDGEAILLLQHEFPTHVIEQLPGYNAQYAKNEKDFNRVILKQIPHFLQTIDKEQSAVEQLCEKHKIDVIVSDNRYGAYVKSLPSFFIGHQLYLQLPFNKWVEKIVNQFHLKMLNKFTAIWVPDQEPPNSLAGKLTKRFKGEKRYLGILSRFEKLNLPIINTICVVLSGPEPQRGILEEILFHKLTNFNEKTVVVRGTTSPSQVDWSKLNHVKLYNLCQAKQLNQLVEESALVICRAGYSSVMDLIRLQKQAILIPTPGQTEQLYLAKSLKEKGSFYTVDQLDLELVEDVMQARKYDVPKEIPVIWHWENLLKA